MDLKATLHRVQELSAQDIASYFVAYHPQIADIPDPWAERVVSWLEEYVNRPGAKALRPLLVAVGAAMSQDISFDAAVQQPAVRQLMMAVELNHKRILMADDVADQDELRHGGPAMHIFIAQKLREFPQYADLSEEQVNHVARSYTEVAGIWLHAMVSDIMMNLEVSAEQRQQVSHIFLHLTYDMTATGWYTLLDQNFITLEDAREDTFLEGLRLVTGEYTFVSPLLLGATLGEKYAELKGPFTEYGRNAGVLFQITDDLIGLFGDPQETGKPVGNDLREGKKTLLVQYAAEKASATEKADLAALLRKEAISAAEVAWAQDLIRRTGAEERTRETAAQYLVRAEQGLNTVHKNELREMLLHIVQYVLHRSR
ncbi:polyprenyl synthetase family protein [Candidatus Woesebacteria bacterium]|nr:polyprenyl synthetase family protein [Candidatus Woesebacteria bacterium]MCD8507149.1 polyprenyl synthetase family protein [Candidatus Woesebacteria bacterium]MCD8527189.1 polyprenyl synthetase family protein [Candidatus Woesebacteria bacterium]MCD8545957.1 polyprenyl synthetase family protein [Candidatus Woesebacteria bacterium]